MVGLMFADSILMIVLIQGTPYFNSGDTILNY